jgi:hypothetical protein
VSNVLTIVLGQNPYIIIQFGFFTAWVYLRFFKLSENGEFRGDRSETFAFVNWFPPLVRYVTVENRLLARSLFPSRITEVPLERLPTLFSTLLSDSKSSSHGITQSPPLAERRIRCYPDQAVVPELKPRGDGECTLWLRSHP